MAPKPQALLFLLLLPLLLLLSPVTASNILEILKPLNDYSTFTNYLVEANLVDEINRHDNITVLAVKNSEMSPISSLPADVRKNVMSVHVLLGYYDPYIVTHFHNKSSLVPTLFQATGLATNQNGYVKVMKRPIRQILFGSGTPGSPVDSYLISVVGTNSDKISVLHISDPIIPPGIEGPNKAAAPATMTSTASSPTKQVTPAPAPVEKKTAVAPANAPEVAPTPMNAPKPSASAPDGSPVEKKTAVATANAPEVAPTPMNAPKPSASAPDASKVAPTPTNAPKTSASAPDASKVAPTPTDAPKPSASAPSIENVPETPATQPNEAEKAPTAPSSASRVVVGATMGLAMGVVLLGVW